MVDIIDYTSLDVASTAIRMCHDTVCSSDTSNGTIGDKDKALIKRVGVKMKHASTLEHLRLVFGIKQLFNINNTKDRHILNLVANIINIFEKNKYSIVTTSYNNKCFYNYIVSTNMRVVVENKDKFTDNMLDLFLPNEYKYLLKEEE